MEIHVQAESADDRAVNLLHEASNLSKAAVKSAMSKGAVWITRRNHSQRLRRATRPLLPGDWLHLYYNKEVLDEVPPQPSLIADKGGYSVWFKPRGMRSQGSKWGDHCTIMRWAEQHLQPERTSFTVHRLDLATNGLILVAHSKTIAAALSKLFRERQITKRYRAIVSGDMSPLSKPLIIDQPIDAKPARTEAAFVALADNGNRSLLDVRTYTGRKHQIRRHLASLGHPIMGDRLYGDGGDDGVDLQLTAYLLSFLCPVDDTPVEYRLPETQLPELN